MRWLISWLFPRRPRGPTPEALAAKESAARSMVRAKQDCAKAVELRGEAAQVTARLRAHNSANRYDEWLRGVIRP